MSSHQSATNKEANALPEPLKILEQHFPTLASLLEAVTNPSEKEQVLTALVYGLFYGEIDSSSEFFPLQVLAEKVSHQTLQAVLKRLPFEKTVPLIAYLFSHYREGTPRLLQGLSTLHEKSAIATLIFWLQRTYFDKDKITTHSVQELICHLEKDAFEQTETIYILFNELVAKMVERADAPQKQFHAYLKRSYSLGNFLDFVKRFGLTGYCPTFPKGELEGEHLLSKVIALHRLFFSQQALPPLLSYQAYSFVSSIIGTLFALIDQPQLFKAGLAHFSCTIATKGKALADTPTLESLVQGYRQLLAFLNEEHLIKDYPIFVFDQSDETLFKQNQAYIDSLGCNIVHISQSEALQRAQELGLEGLLDTTKRGDFGFGGARNCQFLLTAAFKNQKALSDSDFIYMIDDDIEIPACNLFSAALFAKTCHSYYIASDGYHTGRYTKAGLDYCDLEELLQRADKLQIFAPWSDEEVGASVSEHITKPRICLNIPHGGEERHLGIRAQLHVFLKCSKHLAGTRFPKKEIPSHFLVGLHDYLKSYLPYVFLVMMSSELIDSMNKHNRLVFPWNDLSKIGSFSSLHEVFSYIQSESTQNTMCERFLKNVRTCFQAASGLFATSLQKLMRLDVATVIGSFEQQSALSPHEQEELHKLGALYTHLQEDARFLWHYATQLPSDKDVDAIPRALPNLSEYPLTEGFYLMASAIVKGQFRAHIAQALKQNKA